MSGSAFSAAVEMGEENVFLELGWRTGDEVTVEVDTGESKEVSGISGTGRLQDDTCFDTASELAAGGQVPISGWEPLSGD